MRYHSEGLSISNWLAAIQSYSMRREYKRIGRQQGHTAFSDKKSSPEWPFLPSDTSCLPGKAWCVCKNTQIGQTGASRQQNMVGEAENHLQAQTAASRSDPAGTNALLATPGATENFLGDFIYLNCNIFYNMILLYYTAVPLHFSIQQYGTTLVISQT